MMSIFKGRKLVIATKHGKEEVIAPVLESRLEVECFVPDNFDTDSLGTFTGEVERATDPLTTARKKCLLAMEISNCDLAIASEGSFGAHPTIPFIPADDEWMFFMDKKNGLEIYARELSTETNFSAQAVKSKEELIYFAERAKFPSHALILRKSHEESIDIVKGIMDWDFLDKSFTGLNKKYQEVFVETDMRAMYNPTRMAVISMAAEKLAAKISTCCPKCNTPGFGIMDAKLGLPCKWCGTPTRSVLSYIYRCTKCSFTKEDLYPNKKKVEEPRFCDICNP